MDIEVITEKYKSKNGMLIKVLQEVQEEYGYIPQDKLIEVSKKMNLPISEVTGVATFYSFFSLKPKGKYTIRVCMGTACYVKGSNEILETLKKELGIDVDGTTKDGLFTLKSNRCIGACGIAPVITVQDDVYGKLTPDKVPEILNNYRSK